MTRPVRSRSGARGGPEGPTPGSVADSGPDADPESVARQIVLRRLTASPRTRAELAADLRKRAVPDDVAGRVLDRFSAVGLVDDEAFAQGWVRERQGSRGLARRALAQELRRKGVAADVVAVALDTVDADDERAAAEALVRKRLRSMQALEPAVQVRRLVAMLARKGYPAGLAFRVVRDVVDRAGHLGDAQAAHEAPDPAGLQAADLDD